MSLRVRLVVPPEEKWKCQSPKAYGEHFGYDGAEGVLIASAGIEGAWVRFDEAAGKYVGCPVNWLQK